MSSLQTTTAPVNANSVALAVLDRWMAERGTYDAQARDDVKLEIRLTGELPIHLIDAEDLVEVQAVWRTALWVADQTPGEDEDTPPWRPSRVRSVSMNRLRDELLALYQPPLRSKRTLEMMKRTFKVIESIGAQSSADITEKLVADMVSTRPADHSCHTTAQLLRCLRIVANFAKRRGYIRETPFAFRPVGQWIRISPPETIRWYTAEEVRAILAVMEADVRESTGWVNWRARRLWAVTACCAYGGFRMTEAFTLWVDDIDLEASIITVRARQRLKTVGSARMVPMPPRLKQILAEEWLPFRQSAPEGFLDEAAMACPFAFPGVTRKSYWHGGPSEQKPLSRLKSVAQRAGIANFGDATFSKFRHAWACQAEFLGISGAAIMRVMGHTTELTSLKNYRHSIEQNLRTTVQDFEY